MLKKQKHFFNRKGFTLMELVMVVLIIGILTGVALPKYRRSVFRAEMVEGLTQGRTIYDSVVRYMDVNNVPPTSFSQIDIGFIGSDTDSYRDEENHLVYTNEFNDGSFTYKLNPLPLQYITVRNAKAGYQLRFMYPQQDSTGVYAPIMCCNEPNSPTGLWLCNNMTGANESDSGNVHCNEIK